MQSPARESSVWKSPLYDQYWRLKDSVPGCALFFRLGDFYELFGQDALDCAPLLEVQLTSRDKSSDSPIPMCGVPAHAVDSYAEKLLSKGRRIALAEQVSTPGEGKSKLVERAIKRVLTPGLPIDFGRLDAKSPHWFVSLGKATPKTLELLAYDFLGGELFAGRVNDAAELAELLKRLDPKEILLPSSWLADKAFADSWPALNDRSVYFARMTPWSGEQARENLEAYLIYTQRCDRAALSSLLPDARDLARLAGARESEWAVTPANVFEHWAVFPELADLLDACGSAVGSRRLRSLLTSPLRKRERILRRQAAFGGFEDPAAVLALTKEVYDFERILGRFRVGAAQPRELLRFVTSFRAAETALSLPLSTSQAWSDFIRDEGLPPLANLREELRPLLAQLEAALAVGVDANRMTQLSELVKAGFDAEFDRLLVGQNTGEEWLAQYEEKLRTETGISSLKVRYNRVFGYYVEVTKTHLEKVPSYFERKQTTVGGERFTTAELRAKESDILLAGARAEQKAREILEGLQREILRHDRALRDFTAHFAWVDAVAGLLHSVRRLRRFGPWVQPEILEGDFRFAMTEGRHPLIETLTGSFVPNSLALGGEGGKRCLVLTGPNMAGKSTLMRQTGLCLLLGQCGLPVPASEMSFAPCSGFYSRMGATDRILSGESTFMVEMTETASILRSADAQSFILLDEIGRGTSTQDGLAIARAVLEHIHGELKALCLFATHYHELSEVAATLPQAVNGSMGLREWKGELIFLRTLEMKPAESSHGIFVAKMAGLPRSLLTRAQQVFNDLHSHAGQLTLDFSTVSAPASSAPAVEVDPQAAQLRDELRRVDLDNLSPRDAWRELERLREQYATEN